MKTAAREHTIWKFPIHVTSRTVLRVPASARFLSVQEQAGTLCLWAVVDPSAPVVERHIVIYGTGHLIGNLNRLSFIATAQMGALVWHVFEVTADALLVERAEAEVKPC